MTWQLSNETNVSLPPVGDVLNDSPAHLLQLTAGRHAEKTHTIDGNGAQNDNLYQITGTVLIKFILFHTTTVTDSTTFSGVKFELWDGTAATDITGTVDGSGCTAGAFFYKRDLATSALRYLDSSAGVVEEAAANKISFEPFMLVQKNATNTYIRLAFTGDGSTDIDAAFVLHWVPMTDGATVVVV